MDGFRLGVNVLIQSEVNSEPVKRGIDHFYRDLKMTLEYENGEAGNSGEIILKKSRMERESYVIRVQSTDRMLIEAADDLGFIYAFLYISRHYLGIRAFWFWNDQKFVKMQQVWIPIADYYSVPKPVKYRGWFINDEVLISRWDAGKTAEYPWEMAFEALLRCGGNLVIPGTDKNSKRYAELAASMGLWMTHHHAEPLGAEMFLRAYPDQNPSFKENPDLFRRLWEEGVKRQKDYKIIWNLGFRGQGDVPFWECDPAYDTPEKRGKLIGSIMQEQYDMVKKYVSEPVCCTNLYGETMELYRQGYLTLPEDVIMIWADNGYGKMVSRRQGNHNPRIESLPEKQLKSKNHGVYYHVSFYDLQAANVLTMIPNSMEFVEKELKTAYDRGIREMWLVNCSNIKPHVYPLDFVASLWNGEGIQPEIHLDHYLRSYYMNPETRQNEENETLIKQMKYCVQEYFKCMIPYGTREDEHAGEQFYNYTVRILIHGWMKNGGNAPCEELNWCAFKRTFSEQVQWFLDVCEKGYGGLKNLLNSCEETAAKTGQLWKDSLLLQVKIHTWCLEGAIRFARGYEAYSRELYLEAFYELGQAAKRYQEAADAMRECCHDKWAGFYDNDCQTDIKETAYLLKLLMGYVRNLGDGPYFYQWQRLVTYSEQDRRILLLTNEENHFTDEELYLAMKEKAGYVKNLQDVLK